MPRVVKRVVVLVVGWMFILLGIAGLFLPILQGILFLLIGLAILSSESRTARRLIVALRRRYPRLSRRMDEAERRARKWFDRIARRNNDAA